MDLEPPALSNGLTWVIHVSCTVALVLTVAVPGPGQKAGAAVTLLPAEPLELVNVLPAVCCARATVMATTAPKLAVARSKVRSRDRPVIVRPPRGPAARSARAGPC